MKAWPTVPDALRALVIDDKGQSNGGVTVTTSVFVSVAQPLTAFRDILYVPGPVNVPEITPVEDAKVNPTGRIPVESTVAEEGAPATVVVIVYEKALPT